MSLTKIDGSFEISAEQLKTLEQSRIIPKGTPASQVEVFAQVCREKGLSPFSKEIYLVPNYSKKTQTTSYHTITGINGFRAIANRTGLFAGVDQAKFDLQPNGNYKTPANYKRGELPQTCSITVYKVVHGIRCPFEHTAVFSEFSSGKLKWASMPFQMIAKVAESFALRKAFGVELSGLHIHEEGAALADETIEIKYNKNTPNLDDVKNILKRVSKYASPEELIKKAGTVYEIEDWLVSLIETAYNQSLTEEEINEYYNENANGSN